LVELFAFAPSATGGGAAKARCCLATTFRGCAAPPATAASAISGTAPMRGIISMTRRWECGEAIAGVVECVEWVGLVGMVDVDELAGLAGLVELV